MKISLHRTMRWRDMKYRSNYCINRSSGIIPSTSYIEKDNIWNICETSRWDFNRACSNHEVCPQLGKPSARPSALAPKRREDTEMTCGDFHVYDDAMSVRSMRHIPTWYEHLSRHLSRKERDQRTIRYDRYRNVAWILTEGRDSTSSRDMALCYQAAHLLEDRRWSCWYQKYSDKQDVSLRK